MYKVRKFNTLEDFENAINKHDEMILDSWMVTVTGIVAVFAVLPKLEIPGCQFHTAPEPLPAGDAMFRTAPGGCVSVPSVSEQLQADLEPLPDSTGLTDHGKRFCI